MVYTLCIYNIEVPYTVLANPKNMWVARKRAARAHLKHDRVPLL